MLPVNRTEMGGTLHALLMSGSNLLRVPTVRSRHTAQTSDSVPGQNAHAGGMDENGYMQCDRVQLVYGRNSLEVLGCLLGHVVQGRLLPGHGVQLHQALQ